MRWFVLRLFADRPFSPDHLAKAIIGADRGHRGTAAINPCRTYSRVLALNGKTIDWRHNALPLGTKADRARFKGMNALSDWPRNLAPQSAFTCPAIPQSQATHARA